MTVKLFHNPQSRAVMMHWLLEELGIDYELVPVEYEDGSMRSDDFFKVSPLGKIPALLDGEVSVSDTPAITIYLADKYKKPNDMAPDIDDPRRGDYLRWIAFQSTAIDPAMLQSGMKFETQRRQAGWGNVELVVDALETRLEAADPYLCGDWFTAADVVLGSGAAWANMFDLFPERPATKAYIDRLAERPAFVRTIGASRG